MGEKDDSEALGDVDRRDTLMLARSSIPTVRELGQENIWESRLR